MTRGLLKFLFICTVTCGLAAAARASVVAPLDPLQLEAGADAVVEGRVRLVQSAWNADHTGLETRIEVEVHRRLSGVVPPVAVIIQPGGELDGNRHIIEGMPRFVDGEDVRLYLRALSSVGGEPRYRVYGWEQGKWTRSMRDGVPVYAPHVTPTTQSPFSYHFSTNGMRWPASKIPVAYKLHSAGSQDVSMDQVRTAVDAAFGVWAAVPCSALDFTYAGETTLGVAVDQENVLLFIESDWIYGEEAAGATSLWIPIEGQQTADIALNGEYFLWAVGPPGSTARTTMDLQGVLAHEIGHFSGLGHTERAFDTMYYAWSPWRGQRTLSVDDKLGLCSIYPTQGDECESDSACPVGETCEAHERGALCEGQPAPIGTPCNHDLAECDGFCLYTSLNLSTGYCSRLCDSHADCPPSHHCAPASAGSTSVNACFEGPSMLDAGVGDAADAATVDSGESTDAAMPDAAATEPDAGDGCGVCRRGTRCDPVARRCTFDCRSNEDCGSGNFCDEEGRCMAEDQAPAGCACASAGAPPIEGLALLTILAALSLQRARWRRHLR